jgi:hypothetical protein
MLKVMTILNMEVVIWLQRVVSMLPALKMYKIANEQTAPLHAVKSSNYLK